MGQPISVVEKRSHNPAVVRFETNRPLSGMGHERYVESPELLLGRPVDELARRLFARGGVQAVHINGSVVTVTLSPGCTGDGLADVVRTLFLHYPDAPTGAAAAASGDDGAVEPAAEPAPQLSDAEAAPEATADPAIATDETIDDAPAPSGPIVDEPPPSEPEVIADPAVADEPPAPPS